MIKEKPSLLEYSKRPDVGVGVPWLWQLPKDHVFFWPAVKHDYAYDYERHMYESSLIPDNNFLKDMKEVIKKQKLGRYRKIQANFFYLLSRAYGVLAW